MDGWVDGRVDGRTDGRTDRKSSSSKCWSLRKGLFVSEDTLPQNHIRDINAVGFLYVAKHQHFRIIFVYLFICIFHYLLID